MIERDHGVLNGWVDPAHGADFAHLSLELKRFATRQRERYPLRDGRARLECYPELTVRSRPYDPAQDEHLWSMARMGSYLATFRFQRKVELNGRITLLNREYSVGRDCKRRTLAIQLDADTFEWVVYEDDGREIQRFVPKDLDYTTISQMLPAYRHRGTT